MEYYLNFAPHSSLHSSHEMDHQRMLPQEQKYFEESKKDNFSLDQVNMYISSWQSLMFYDYSIFLTIINLVSCFKLRR